MKLNAIETLLINNPVRDAMLDASVRWLYRTAGQPALAHVLEVGCGQGAGARAIVAQVQPRRFDGFDLDEKQVARAEPQRQQLAQILPVRLWVGDAEHIDAPDAAYDAVFEFTIFHHIPDWRRAIAEVHRVLRPGGLFLFEELSRELFYDTPLLGRALRRFTVHPWDTMFTFAEFQTALGERGFETLAVRPHPPLVGWHHGVARKPA